MIQLGRERKVRHALTISHHPFSDIAEQSSRFDHQDDDQHREDGDIAVLTSRPQGGERFHQADGQTADQSAVNSQPAMPNSQGLDRPLNVFGQIKKNIVKAGADNGADQAVYQDVDQMLGVLASSLDAPVSDRVAGQDSRGDYQTVPSNRNRTDRKSDSGTRQ